MYIINMRETVVKPYFAEIGAKKETGVPERTPADGQLSTHLRHADELCIV